MLVESTLCSFEKVFLWFVGEDMKNIVGVGTKDERNWWLL